MSTSQQSRSNATEKITELEMTDFSHVSSSSPSVQLQPIYPTQTSETPSSDVDKEKSHAQAEYNKKKHKGKHKLNSVIEEQELKKPPQAAILDAVVIKSDLANRDSLKQSENIKKRFNEDVKDSAFSPEGWLTSVGLRGEFLQPDEFKLHSRNRVAELAMFNKDYNTAKSFKADGTEVIDHGKFKTYDLFFGANGKFVLNVPPDKFAKASSGNTPFIFGPGPHVIRDANFKFDQQTGFVNQSDAVISHGTLHVIRVPKGQLAKVTINNEQYILEYQVEPYVFNSPLFTIAKNGNDYFFNANDYVTDHGTVHILRIPAGCVAKVWDGSTPYFLPSRDKPYIFDSTQFRHVKNAERNYFDASTRVLLHGTLAIIRVPSGSIAKVLIDSEPRLLEARDEPYEFNSSYFSIEQNGASYFFSATEKLIVHGSIKRILPPINHVAITNDGGAIKIIGASKDGKPTIIDSPSHYVEDFLSVATETLVFPSDETKAQRLKDDKDASKESLIYEIFTTKDSLKVCVKLLVAYKIDDPELVVKTLGMKGIVPHIENLANVDMGMAIQQSSSQEFMTSYQTKPHRNEGLPGSYGSGQDRPPQHYQDIVKEKLAADLKEVGIRLIRLNVENPKPLKKEIADKMEEQSVETAKINAEEARLRQTYNIQLANAEREAAIKKVAVDQENAARLSTAQAKFEAAELEAKAKTVAARADADATVLKAEAEAKATVLKADADAKAITVTLQAEGKALEDNPALLKLQVKRLEMHAVENANYLPTNAGTLPANMVMNPLAFFNKFTENDTAAPALPVQAQAADRSTRAPSLSQQQEQGQ